ncbi:hypothetical protein GCM10011611_34230 [Aliidongia dinghuensis]|uniref:DUF2066 domain-containing protein n=1 Tax=Aliidongia dinghuensis TaxID=1867774 RepID=A0A8J2YV31_9PROT|nr:DUF2066 domain-containing protein [Aliidongia dinghuensis]GGF25333.1 hypothetical protein GCM10011611_34230 [Aliidongia dinghuensis]
MIERRFPGLRMAGPGPFGAAVLALALLLWARPAAAAGFPSAYVVADVPVDATAQSAVQAREAARLDGERRAFRQLLERLTQKGDWQRLPQPSDDTIVNLIQDFEVKDEHSSSVRYLASYTYRFSPNGVRKLLHEAHLTVTELASKPVVIVPLLRTGDTARLWDDPNPWRAAWGAANGRSGLVPWVLPTGDLADMSVLDAPAAGKPAPEQLQALAQHYGGGDVVVATAAPGGDGLEVTVARYSPDGSADPVTVQVPGAKADTALYAAGVVAAEKALEDKWKQLTFGGGEQESILSVTVPITSAADWGAVRERLSKIPFVRGEQVDLFGHSEVHIRLRVRGSADLLKIGFAQQDLVFTPGQPTATLALKTPVSAAQPASAAPVSAGQ